MDIGTTGIINANVWISGESSDGLGNFRQQVPFDFGGMSFCFVPRVLGRIIVVMFWKHGPKYLTDLKWLCLQFCAVYIHIKYPNDDYHIFHTRVGAMGMCFSEAFA